MGDSVQSIPMITRSPIKGFRNGEQWGRTIQTTEGIQAMIQFEASLMDLGLNLAIHKTYPK